MNALPDLPESADTRRIAVRSVWISVTLAIVVAVAAHVRGADESPNTQDRALDLLLGRRIANEGVLTDGARSPLFPALLATVEGSDPGYYQRARWLAIAIGALGFGAVYLASRRAVGDRAALAATLALGPEWTFQVSRIRPEPLAATLLVFAVVRLATRASCSRPLMPVFVAGILVGLSHLAKGSGPLTLAAGIAYLVVAERRAGRRALPAVGLLAAGFLLAAAPLFVDCALRFGSPFHNVNSAHVLWEEFPDEEQWRWSAATPATWWSRHAPHGVHDAVARLAAGAAKITHGPWIYAFLAAAAVGAVVSRRRRADGPPASASPAPLAGFVGVSACVALAWLPPFWWYVQIGNSRRYLFPVLVLSVIGLAALLERGIRLAAPRVARGLDAALDGVVRVVGTPIAAAIVLALLVAAEVRERADPPAGGPRRPFDEATIAAAARLDEMPAGSRVFAGPAAEAPSPWLVYPRVEYVVLPSGLSPDAAAAWIRAHADYALITANLRDRRPEAFLDAGASAATPTWAESVWTSPGDAPRFVIVRVK